MLTEIRSSIAVARLGHAGHEQGLVDDLFADLGITLPVANKSKALLKEIVQMRTGPFEAFALKLCFGI